VILRRSVELRWKEMLPHLSSGPLLYIIKLRVRDRPFSKAAFQQCGSSRVRAKKTTRKNNPWSTCACTGRPLPVLFIRNAKQAPNNCRTLCERIERWNNVVQVNIDENTALSVGERAAAIYSRKSAE
jgi:hypothetical protein